ncbi:MAG: HAMP domain-containing histidine kinase, partial [Chloroflexi bacterium]|nr:HAMP domain-containing histidine kinase [Chloroflexota bacterium]
MKENSETFKFQLLDLRLDILNRGVLLLLFLTGFLGMATTPFETENTPALLVYAAILALSFASGYLSWMGQQRAPLWLSAWGALALSILLVVAARGRISPLWISVTCALPLLLVGPRGGWGAVVIANASLAYITLTRPATVPFPLAIEAALLAVMAIFFANVTWQVMCETLNWMSEGYELAFKQSDELRTKSAELESALKSLGQTSFALARANEQLGIMVKFAEDARRSKQEFAANISHELRTPLNLIIGFSDVILNAPATYYAERLPPKLLADIQTIHRNAQHLSSLVNDILDLSQMDVNYMTIVREPLHMDEFIHSALDDFMPLVTLRGLSLQTNVEPDLPEIYADRTRIRQVLLNLLNNALRFTDAGGITICASSRRSAMHHQEKHPDLLSGSVESEIGNPKSEIVISVTDTGTGITPDDLQRIFEPFTQVDNSIRRKHGGSGLGLTISKRFVELHGGQMWVESTPGIGSTFYFSLPVTPPAHAIGIESTPQQVRRYEVGALAVVEQNPTLSRLLERHLEGITITHTSSVDKLAEIAKTNCPEAVLMNEPIESALLPDHWPSVLKQTPVMHCYLAGTTERILASISQREQMADQGAGSAGDRVPHADGSVPNRLAQQRYFLPKPIMREQFYEVLAQMLASDVATTPPHLPLPRGGARRPSPLLGKEGPG